MRIGILLFALAIFAVMAWGIFMHMPGDSYSGPLPELDEDGRILRDELEKDVRYLSEKVGVRNLFHPEGLDRAAEYIAEQFRLAGYEPEIQEYKADGGILSSFRGAPTEDKNVYKNVVAELRGMSLSAEIIVVGAHYDSVPVDGCVAANDNASGVAAVLALARRFAKAKPDRTVRFVAFTNEEPPYFWTNSMGSLVYAKSCKDKKENIVGMITPETIGYFSDEERSQDYPFPLSYFYPSKGNFIAFVGGASSSSFVKRCVGIFREKAKFPSEGAALPMFIPGIGWSDHWSFAKCGYPALMMTDTAPFRYPYYHSSGDTADKLDFDKMAMVVRGLELVIEELASGR